MILDDLLAAGWRPCSEFELTMSGAAKRGAYSPRGWRDYPICLCNDRPPPVVVNMFVHTHQGETYTSFEVSIVGESKHGWLSFKAYSLKEGAVMNAIEYIIKAWTSANE